MIHENIVEIMVGLCMLFLYAMERIVSTHFESPKDWRNFNFTVFKRVFVFIFSLIPIYVLIYWLAHAGPCVIAMVIIITVALLEYFEV